MSFEVAIVTVFCCLVIGGMLYFFYCALQQRHDLPEQTPHYVQQPPAPTVVYTTKPQDVIISMVPAEMIYAETPELPKPSPPTTGTGSTASTGLNSEANHTHTINVGPQ